MGDPEQEDTGKKDAITGVERHTEKSKMNMSWSKNAQPCGRVQIRNMG